MHSEFARDLADADRPLHQALASRPGKPIKIRIQPSLLVGAQYRSWKDVRWTIECDTPAEGIAVREALRLFFRTLADEGPAAIESRLTAPSQAGAA